MSTSHGHRHHHHDDVDEGAWEAMGERMELEGAVLMPLLAETLDWLEQVRRQQDTSIERIVDVGSGPGIGTCELARRYEQADVLAIDQSEAFLERTVERAGASQLDGRVGTCRAELPDEAVEVGGADLVWASMVIHHIEDRTGTLRQLGASLRPGGLLTVVEFGDRPRYLPDDLPIGPPGLQDRLGAANDRWLASMGFDLTSEQLVDDAAGAGLELVAERVFSMRLEPPLPADARRVVRAQLDRARSVYADELDDADLAALDTLCDDDGAEGALQRADLFLATSRHAYAFAGRS